eukprot:7260503-Prymnesium_polylepis.1
MLADIGMPTLQSVAPMQWMTEAKAPGASTHAALPFDARGSSAADGAIDPTFSTTAASIGTTFICITLGSFRPVSRGAGAGVGRIPCTCCVFVPPGRLRS